MYKESSYVYLIIYNCYVHTIHKGIIVHHSSNCSSCQELDPLLLSSLISLKSKISTIHYLIPLGFLCNNKFNGLDVGWMLTGQNAAGEDSRISPFVLVRKEV